MKDNSIVNIIKKLLLATIIGDKEEIKRIKKEMEVKEIEDENMGEQKL